MPKKDFFERAGTGTYPAVTLRIYPPASIRRQRPPAVSLPTSFNLFKEMSSLLKVEVLE
jgi:hypothetical protein